MVGATVTVGGTHRAVARREKRADYDHREVAEMSTVVRGCLKAIKGMYERAETEPGFWPPEEPIPPENP